MELLGNIKRGSDNNDQVLDTLKVEKERGITVKAQTVSMIYRNEISGTKYLLNLIDTPGHYDFSFEVRRSLSACQGALLLVDSTQGIQAQTYSTYDMAMSNHLVTIPVLTKIDMQNSDSESVAVSLTNAFEQLACKSIRTSAKTGEGIQQVVQNIIDYIPPPPIKPIDELCCLVIDTWFSVYEGVTCLILVQSGTIRVGDKIKLNGMVGTLTAGITSIHEAPIGSSIITPEGAQVLTRSVLPLTKPMIYSCIFPEDSSKYDSLKKDIKKLCLNDASVTVKLENSQALGPGFRCGFVGRLHLEVFLQRLRDEYHQQVLATPPSVSYTVVYEDNEEAIFSTPYQFPSKIDGRRRVAHYLEPFAKVIIVVQESYIGDLIQMMIVEKRSEQTKHEYIGGGKVLLEFDTPLEEVICDIVERVKSTSSGTASFDYHLVEPRRANIQRVDIYIADEMIEVLSFITHQSKAYHLSKELLTRLKEVVSHKQFEVVIQAKIGNKVICRESVRAMRKDVLTKAGKTIGGGDVTRKMKLLDKQKKGKKKMKRTGKVNLSQKDVLQALYR